MRLLVCLALCLAPTAVAQHSHGASAPDSSGVLEAFTVTGLRVGDAPPPGSGVGRAGLRFADGGYVAVTYGQPFVRGRTVFGGLVGRGAIWSLGAHRATELWTTVPLVIGGTRIEPGGYSLLATPGNRTWTLHVNRALGAHLADEYDPAEDVARATAPVSTLDAVQDALMIAFDTDGGLALRIAWETTAVAFPFERAD